LKTVAIIGGGVAGLICGIELSKNKVPCLLFERKNYPLHRVCGEYVSNEALPYLKSINALPLNISFPEIRKFQLTSVRGQSATMPLDLGGFGISRHTFDEHLYQRALSEGSQVHVNTEVTSLTRKGQKFLIDTNKGSYEADVVIGSFGKRSKLDVQLQRGFIRKRSPYVGIKYHATITHDSDVVSLHNFEGGYCGVVNVENGISNICYLLERDVLKRFGNIREMEQNVLYKNPLLAEIFSSLEFQPKPEVINEISFATKGPIENNMLMVGDAAGMITPLCGNGMAMAIHSAKIASELVLKFCEDEIDFDTLMNQYSGKWKLIFANRLRIGRTVQKLFGNKMLSSFAVELVLKSKSLSTYIMKQTHGQPF
jgi:menaquinone-9 beta-reductase